MKTKNYIEKNSRKSWKQIFALLFLKSNKKFKKSDLKVFGKKVEKKNY